MASRHSYELYTLVRTCPALSYHVRAADREVSSLARLRYRSIVKEFSGVKLLMSRHKKNRATAANNRQLFRNASSTIITSYNRAILETCQFGGVKCRQLIEYLEIPQLLDTCVRNGLIEESVLISLFVIQIELAPRHIHTGGGAILLAEILYQVSAQAARLRDVWLLQLELPRLQTPGLNTFHFIRRLNIIVLRIQTSLCRHIFSVDTRRTHYSSLASVGLATPFFNPIFTDIHLQHFFLQRHAGRLSTEANDHGSFMSAWSSILSIFIEHHRTQFSERLAQFSAFFCDRYLGVNTPETRVEIHAKFDLASWLTWSVRNLFDSVGLYLPLGEQTGRALDMLTSVSAGRNGADFRLALMPIVITLLRHSPLHYWQPSATDLNIKKVAKLPRWYFLQRLLNHLLLSFNESRRCNAFPLAFEQAESLVDVFKCVRTWDIADAIISRRRPLNYNSKSLSRKKTKLLESQVFQCLISCFIEVNPTSAVYVASQILRL